MALTLILTRHAKSAWDDPALDDFERPLNGRGRSSAVKIGQWLAGQGHLPDIVLVSSARRCGETWSRMANLLPSTATMESVPALYLASADIIMNVLRAQNAPAIMLIAHNPGIGHFASSILSDQPTHEKFDKYPTGATTVVSFDAPTWRDIEWGTGSLVDFVVPREL